MHTRLIAVAAAVGAAMVAGGSVAIASSGSPTITRAHTLQVKGTSTSFHFVDVGRKGFSLGDQFVLTERLTRHGKRVGHVDAHCTIISRHDTICEATALLPAGKITFGGAISSNAGSPGSRFTFAITGGTRQYQNVRGQVTLHQLTENTDEQTYNLLP